MTINTHFQPAKKWYDTDGNPIAAHGGGIMQAGDTYYWYGEARISFNKFPGIMCYSSRDLLNWKNEGYVLHPVKDDPAHDLYETNVIERPKVIYNDKTGKYVMWMHVENHTYTLAHSGVAVSDSPTGPFQYIKSMRPNGHEARDMTLFKDDDGTAYLVHASEKNATTHINRLQEDYLDVDGVWARAFDNRFREAPAFFKHEGKYYCISSNTTGFSPNVSEYGVANSMLGPWRTIGDPCVGIGSESTFHSQSNFAIPVKSGHCSYILMCDHWYPKSLKDSWYSWFPIDIVDGRVEVRWYDRWNLEERIEGEGYRETPEGSPISIPQGSVDVERKPDIVLLPREPQQVNSALVWTAWQKGQIEVAVWVHDKSGQAMPNDGDWLMDIFINYYNIGLYGDGRVQQLVNWGCGCAGRNQIRLNSWSNPGINCRNLSGVTTPHAGLLNLSEDAKGTLYTICAEERMAPMRPIEANETTAFAVVLHDLPSEAGATGRGTNAAREGRWAASYTVSPEDMILLNTDTYHAAVLKP